MDFRRIDPNPNPINDNLLVNQALRLNNALKKVVSNRTTYIFGIFARSKPTQEQIEVNTKLSFFHEGMRKTLKDLDVLKKQINLIKNNPNLDSQKKEQALNRLNHQLTVISSSYEVLNNEMNQFKADLNKKGMSWKGQAKLLKTVNKDLKRLSTNIEKGLIASDYHLNKANELYNRARSIYIEIALDGFDPSSKDGKNEIKQLRKEFNQLKSFVSNHENTPLSGRIDAQMKKLSSLIDNLDPPRQTPLDQSDGTQSTASQLVYSDETTDSYSSQESYNETKSETENTQDRQKRVYNQEETQSISKQNGLQKTEMIPAIVAQTEEILGKDFPNLNAYQQALVKFLNIQTDIEPSVEDFAGKQNILQFYSHFIALASNQHDEVSRLLKAGINPPLNNKMQVLNNAFLDISLFALSHLSRSDVELVKNLHRLIIQKCGNPNLQLLSDSMPGSSTSTSNRTDIATRETETYLKGLNENDRQMYEGYEDYTYHPTYDYWKKSKWDMVGSSNETSVLKGQWTAAYKKPGVKTSEASASLDLSSVGPLTPDQKDKVFEFLADWCTLREEDRPSLYEKLMAAETFSPTKNLSSFEKLNFLSIEQFREVLSVAEQFSQDSIQAMNVAFINFGK